MSAFEWNDVRYDFHPSSIIGKKQEHVDANGLRGTLVHSIERNLDGIYRVNGQLKFIPTPTELDTLLPIMHGAAKTGVGPYTYPFGESLTGYTIVVDRVTKVHTYANVKVAKYRFSNEQAGPLSLDVDVIGTTETEAAAGTFSSTAIDVATKPWMMSQMTLTIASTTFTPQSFEWEVDYGFDAERFFNSQTLSTGANATDLSMRVKAVLPYGDSAAVYTTHSANTGVQVVATWTNGVYILTATFVKVAFRAMAPEINSRGEIMLPIEGVAMRSASTSPLVLTLALS